VTDSSIGYNSKGDAVSFTGPDAVNLYRCATLWSSIKLLQAGIQPTRGFTMAKALKMATGYTGKAYKRSQSEQARTDLKVWMDAMKAALPVEVQS
jgi:hypothetical protein